MSRSHEFVSVPEGVNHFVIAGRLLKAFLNTVGSSGLKPVTLLSAHSEHGAVGHTVAGVCNCATLDSVLENEMAQRLERLERSASARVVVPHIECVLRPAKAAVHSKHQAIDSNKNSTRPRMASKQGQPGSGQSMSTQCIA